MPAPSKSMDIRYRELRLRMVSEQICRRGVNCRRTLEAMRDVPRHLFVPESYRALSYTDGPLPIGYGQTISQPYIVAVMTELLELKGGEKVLEIGTGSAYQAAILSACGAQVYSMEIVSQLAVRARKLAETLPIDNVVFREGDAGSGWAEEAPFDVIIVTAAPRLVPRALKDQLKEDGRLVIPVGDEYQELMVFSRDEKGFSEKTVFPVRFVPMTGSSAG